MKDVCIIIPVWKEELDCVEKISLQRFSDVTEGKYDVFFVCPYGLNIKNYLDIYKYAAKSSYFDTKYFESANSYSQLCISYDFYNTYKKYKYMMIYQLDCYLFYDKIKDWVDKGYDFVGPPIFSTNCGWRTERKKPSGTTVYQPMVGNGGFCIRKIKTFMDITDPNGEFRKYTNLDDEKLKAVMWEDLYFCDRLEELYDLKKPTWREAMEFGLDMNVISIYNEMKLNPNPMGIHAIGKNIRYWKDVIPELNTEEIINYCEEKYKDFFKKYYEKHIYLKRDTTINKK